MAIDNLIAFRADRTTGGKGSGRPGSPVDPYRLRRALWQGKGLVLGAGVIGLVVGFLWAKILMDDVYETAVVLKHEGDISVPGLPPVRDEITPAADALKRQSVLRKIAEKTGFDGSLTALEASLPYDIDLMASTVQITVGADTAEDAVESARIVTDVFMDYHRERQARRIEAEIARTKRRIDAAENEIEVARNRYDDFREQHGIANLTSEQRSSVKSAAELRAESELALSEIRALEAQVGSLESQLATTSKTSFLSAGPSPERAEYERLRGELASVKASLSPDHPRVQSLQHQVDGLRSQLRSGGASSSVGGSVVGPNVTYQVLETQLRGTRSDLDALRERQKGLAEMADKAQFRVEAFSDIEGEASALLAEVEVNERLASQLRGTEASLEDALRDPPSGFVVLDPGALPEYPEQSKLKLIVFAAVPTLGFFLALFFVLRREFGKLEVETAAEVAYWGNGPVLAATSWPDYPPGLDEVVAGLDDFVPEANGSLLIVGGSSDESLLAHQLADRMNHDWFVAQEQRGSTQRATRTAGEPVPLQTPPPSGPYPLRRAGNQSVALARRPSVPPVEPISVTNWAKHLQIEAWDGPHEGQALRRAARLAGRVLVLIRSGTMPAPRLNKMQHRIGLERGIGYIVVGLPDELHALPDRVGNVTAFWQP